MFSTVPLIRQPFGLPPSPEGKAEGARNDTYQSRIRQRPSGARGTTGRTDAPALFPLSLGSRPPTEKGICEQVSTRDFSLGAWGTFLFLGKRNVPQKDAPFEVQLVNMKTNPRSQERTPAGIAGRPTLKMCHRHIFFTLRRPDVQPEIALCQLPNKHFPIHIHNMDIGLDIM